MSTRASLIRGFRHFPAYKVPITGVKIQEFGSSDKDKRDTPETGLGWGVEASNGLSQTNPFQW